MGKLKCKKKGVIRTRKIKSLKMQKKKNLNFVFFVLGRL